MNRRKFIKTGCIACTSIGFLSTVIQGCTAVKYSTGTLNGNGILIDVKDYETKNGIRNYVIVRHDDLQFPICVYKIDEQKYSALLMRCTHQGAELQVAGDQLTCPAHGSEFDKWGRVTQSPAAENLRSFPVSIAGDKLFIDLRKQV
ncbi:MAG: Rieske (2Fe-2S) protein [Flavipsychrobacter sp.]|nr:Rieske (2Fe-2S) protein [Flavipsychrobacter sp.]